MSRQALQTIKIFCDNPIHEETKATERDHSVHGDESLSLSHLRSHPQIIDGKLGRFSGSCELPGAGKNQLSQGGKFCSLRHWF